MEIHGNARLLPSQRKLLCERVRLHGWTVAAAAEAFDVAERTVYRWLGRWDAGEPMTDRSSAPRRRPTRTPKALEAQIEQLRRLRWSAPRIDGELGMPTSTVCAVLADSDSNGGVSDRPNRPTATAAATPASSFTSTSRSSAGSTSPVTASPAEVTAATRRRGGSTATSPSTTPPASRMSRSSTTNTPAPQSGFSAARSRGSPPKASPSKP